MSCIVANAKSSFIGIAALLAHLEKILLMSAGSSAVQFGSFDFSLFNPDFPTKNVFIKKFKHQFNCCVLPCVYMSIF